ncbi:IreB family regulatory phosphoprotein [Anaerofustis sp.]|uniref:IreB family regulatory phosphoprotein n=1 Tax=Anaerofustis sp. TaxID=1872517 RepID=UPI0025C02FF3|nr:IreB family regulatory phosphoprotein [Anaerofustis sp.]
MGTNNSNSNYTVQFSLDNDRSKLIEETMKKVKGALEEKGYNPVNQIVGYIMSGDPTYITSYKDARKLIRQVERDEILELLVIKYFSDLK